MTNHNIPYKIEEITENSIYYTAENTDYNIFVWGASPEEARIEANECFDFFLHHYIKTDDNNLTKEAIELKQKYIDYYINSEFDGTYRKLDIELKLDEE